MHEFSYPSEVNTFDECNNPFYLPPNEYVYAEFKRRFSERWTNLSIRVYQTENDALKELAEDFEMKTLTCVNRLLRNGYYERNGLRTVVEKLANEQVLRDEMYISDLANTLVNSGISFQIKNNRFGIYWNRNLLLRRLRDFDGAAA